MVKTLYACLTPDIIHHKITKKHSDSDSDSDIHIVRAAFMKSSIWPQNSTIKIAFAKKPIKSLDGSSNLEDPEYTLEKAQWTQQIVEKYYKPLVNLTFIWDVSIEESDVRISFISSKGSFSVTGTQSLAVPKDTATMNIGWLDKDASNTDKNSLIGTGVVIVHEFGHMLGMIHEHQRQDKPMKWNKEFIYDSLGQPPNNWDRETVDNQLFEQIAMSTLNSSEFDPNSVMEYIFPDNFFTSPQNLQISKYLSNLDIIWVNKTYPGKNLPPGINSDGTGKNPFSGITFNNDTNKTNKTNSTNSTKNNDNNDTNNTNIYVYCLIFLLIVIILAFIINSV
jgi:serralysin